MLQKLLDRLRGRTAEDHEKWLAAHPDKHTGTKGAPVMTSPEEDARVRAQMEAELENARDRRGES